MSKIKVKVLQRPDRTIRVEMEDFAEHLLREEKTLHEIYEEEMFGSDADMVNEYMHYLHMMLQKYEKMSPAMRQFVSPFTGEALRAETCKRDLHLIIWGAGGKVREV